LTSPCNAYTKHAVLASAFYFSRHFQIAEIQAVETVLTFDRGPVDLPIFELCCDWQYCLLKNGIYTAINTVTILSPSLERNSIGSVL
jgi:hypothetical protein